MDMGKKGMPVFSMNDRMSASACAYAAPLPRMMSGRSALASRSRARSIDSGVGNLPGRWLDHVYQRSRGRIGIECRAENFGGQIQIDATRPPDTAAWIARAIPMPISSGLLTRKAALVYGFAAFI